MLKLSQMTLLTRQIGLDSYHNHQNYNRFGGGPVSESVKTFLINIFISLCVLGIGFITMRARHQFSADWRPPSCERTTVSIPQACQGSGGRRRHQHTPPWSLHTSPELGLGGTLLAEGACEDGLFSQRATLLLLQAGQELSIA